MTEDNVKKGITIVGIILFFTILGFLYAFLTPKTNRVTISFDILRVLQTQSDDYRYDAFYAQKATDFFADTIVSWMKNPVFVSKVFSKSGVNEEGISFVSFFDAKKYSAQHILVTFTHADAEIANSLGHTLIEEVQSKAKHVLIGEMGDPIFFIESSYVYIRPYQLSLKLYSIIGLLIGVFFSFLYLKMKIYENRG